MNVITMRRYLALLAEHGVMAGDSRAVQRIALIGAFGEALTDEEVAVFRRITGRYPPRSLASLLALFIGRRGGKDDVAAVVVTFMALCRHWPLAVGEVASVLLLAVDRTQVQVAFKRIRGFMHAVPACEAEIASETRETIVLRNGIEITVATADYAAVRGRTIVCAVLDEYAFWPTEQAIEVPRALRPGMATQPGAVIVIITTIYAAYGPAYELFRQWGVDDPAQLIIRGTTRDFNPLIPQEFIDAELARDYAGNSAEYLTIPRTDREALFDAVLLDSVTRNGPRELPKLPELRGGPVRYFAAVDVSGGRQDAAAAAVTYRDGDKVIVAACRRWPSPHDPVAVAKEVQKFLAGYGLTTAHADQYGAELSRSIYHEAGVVLMSAEVNRSEAYLHALPLFTSGRIELSPEPTLRQELLGLERRTGRSGKDAVDHRPGQHDDLANAVALAAWAASRGSATANMDLLTVVESESLMNSQAFSAFGGHAPDINWRNFD